MRRLGLLALAGLLILASGGFYLYHGYDVPGPLQAATALVVPHGDLAENLTNQGLIDRPWLFRLAVLATRGDGPLHAGELPFPEHASLRQVLIVLRTARPVQHRLTIPEGLTALQVAGLIARADAATGEAAVPAEGSILPETYSYERGTPREQLADRGRVAMDRALDRAWAARMPGLPLANAREALVLASIVERETGRADERPLIAGLFLNRLRLGMKLQSDPTVIYGVSAGAGVLDHGITRAELDSDTPYNTYRIPGLPPGPICNPGIASLHAATHPTATDALYFVADGTGGHVFARTQDEHLKNVVRWREIERARAPPGP